MYAQLYRRDAAVHEGPDRLFKDLGSPGGIPQDIAGRVISALLNIIRTRSSSLLYLLSNVKSHDKVKDIPHIGLYLATDNDLIRFIQGLPQYFTISGRYVRRCEGYTEEVFNAAITKRALEIYPPSVLRRSTYSSSRGGAARGGFGQPDDFIGVLSQTKIIESVGDCQRVLEPIIDASRRETVVIGLDCEGVRLGTEGGCLTLVQISTCEGKSFLFDAYKNPQLLKGNSNLKKILEHDKILKVIHDCKCDTYALYHEFGVTLKNVFDTSIAMSTLMEQLNRCRSYRIGFKSMCELLGEGASHKDDDFVQKMLQTPNFWKIRPLTGEMIYYAASDALCLVPSVYLKLNGMMTPIWRELFKWTCKDTMQGIQKPRYHDTRFPWLLQY